MPRAPFAVTTLLVIAAVCRSTALAMEPAPFAGDGAVVLAISFLGFALIAVTGLLVVRGPWARVLGLLLTAGSLGIAVAAELTTVGLVALAAAGLALAGLSGPWLTRRWLRLLPSADGPPPVAVATVLALLALPAWIAVARPGGLGTGDWVLAGAAVLGAFGLNRALPPALWSIRTLLPIAAIAAAVDGGLPGGIVVAAGALTVTVLAWHPGVGRAVSPLVATSPPAVPIPPELVSPDLLEAAGFDERGRPLESS